MVDEQAPYPRPRDSFQRLLRAHLFHCVVVLFLILRHEHFQRATGFLLLLVEVVDDDTDEQVEGEERPEDDEEHEVEVHVDVGLANRLLAHLSKDSRETIVNRIDEMTEDPELTSRESMASFMIWIQPLNVATWNRHRYAFPTWSKFIGEFSHV